MTNQEKLDQVLKAIETLESQEYCLNQAKVSIPGEQHTFGTIQAAISVLASGAIALREQIKIDNAMDIVNQLKSQGVL